MARVSKVDPCMICGVAPCECNKKVAIKKATPKAQKAKPVKDLELPEQKKSSAFSAMKAKAKPDQTVKVDPGDPDSEGRLARELPDVTEKALFDSAVRALEPVLHQSEKIKYRDVLSSDPTIDERRAAWRARFSR